MSAVQPWMVQMDGVVDGVVDGWWTATMSQQGCNVSKEVAESCSGLESWGDSWLAPLGILKVWKWPLKSVARNASASLAAMGIRGEKLMVWPHPPLTSTLLRTFGASSSKRGVWGLEAVHIQTAALGGYSDILQRNSSRNSPKSSMDARIVKLLPNKGSYVKMGLDLLRCYFWKKCCNHCEVCSTTFELYSNGWWLENYADYHLHRLFRKIREKYHLHNNFERAVSVDLLVVSLKSPYAHKTGFVRKCNLIPVYQDAFTPFNNLDSQ